MKKEATNEDLLVRYLLGRLPEAEQQQIEQRAFDDDEFYQTLLEVEDDLRCAYAQGTLPLSEKQQFEKRFLIFDDERNRVALAREMIAELPGTRTAKASRPASNRLERGTGGLLGRLLGMPIPAMGFAMGAAALLVVAGLVWLLFETTRLRTQINQLQAEKATTENELEQRSADERARAEQLAKQLEVERDLRAELEDELSEDRVQTTEQPGRLSVVGLLLSPGRIRGGGDTKRLDVPAGVKRVQLQLQLTGEVSSGYRAVVMNSEGNEVWTRISLRPRRDGARADILLSIPARLFAEDDYELRLSGLDETGQLERTLSYYFTVLKK